jgi:hypothetical protein
MAASRSRWLVALAGMAMIAAGCGSSGHKASTTIASRLIADPAGVTVIRAWSNALRRGDVNGAARFFALPSEFINGPDEALAIHTEAEARAANATLPCGAQLISAVRRGRFISALFRLTNRPGPDGGCGSGAGQLARTNFVIVDGRILAWIRAPEVSGGGVSPLPTTPSNTQTTGPVA